MSDHQIGDETEHKSQSNKRMLLMALCCLLPLVAVVAVASLFPASSYLSFIFILACPLMMVMMMLPNWLSKKDKKQVAVAIKKIYNCKYCLITNDSRGKIYSRFDLTSYKFCALALYD